MSISDMQKMISGYDRIAEELEICRKYGIDYYTQRGKWTQAVEKYHPRRLELRVSEKFAENADTTTLRLVSTNGYLPPFRAGQYINLFVEIEGICTSRPYSISSSPAQIAYYDLTVRRVPNGFVSDYLLDKVKVGDVLTSTGPAGHFYYSSIHLGNDLVFIAGGSGITPLMSMIREVTDRNLDRNIHLIYGVRKPQEAIFHEELLIRSQRHSNFTYDLAVSEPETGYEGITGFIDADLIKKQIGDVTGKTFFVCGPREMYSFCIPELEKMGVPGRRIRREVFGTPAEVTKEPAWPQEVKADAEFTVKLARGQVIKARAAEPLLIALERSGIVVDNCCRSGECSLCRVKLQAGKVFQPAAALVRKSDQEFGYVHSCAAYPLTDLEILL